jgi:hypothetical protein
MENKPIRQSTIAEFFNCPKAYKIKRNGFEIDDSTAMRDGRTFEDALFARENPELLKKNKTVETIKIQAQYVTEKNIFGVGENHKRYTVDFQDQKITGEFDFVGLMNIPNGSGKIVSKKAIGDVKYTGSIEEIWGKKYRKHDFFQSIFYPYLHYCVTGEKLPFYYVVVDKKYLKPFVKIIEVICTFEDFEWLEHTLEYIFEQKEFPPNEANCLFGGTFSNARCNCIKACDFGRGQMERKATLSFSELEDSLKKSYYDTLYSSRKQKG